MIIDYWLDKMEPKQEIKHLEYTLGMVNYWIDKADAKVSISLGLFPLITAIIQYINSTLYRKTTNMLIVYSFIEVLCAVLSIASILFYVLALKPNLKSSGKNKTKKYLVYYGDICRLDLDDYKSLILKAEENDYADELMNEIHYNSDICYSKMVRFKEGIILSIISICLEICCLAIMVFSS